GCRAWGANRTSPASSPRTAKAAPNVERDANEPATPTASVGKRCAARIQNAKPRPDTETRPTRTQNPWWVTEASAASGRPLVGFSRDTRGSDSNARHRRDNGE